METEEFKVLPDEFKLYGYSRTLIKRTEKGVIYECVDEEDVAAGPTHYEVFCIKTAKAVDINVGGKNVKTPAREKLPSNEDFGVWAWCVTTKDTAFVVLDEIDKGIRPDSSINSHKPEDDIPIINNDGH